MEHRRRGADFSHLLETFCVDAADCESVLESAAQEAQSSMQTNIATSNSDKPYDGDGQMISKTSNGNESATSGSFKSTILAGQAAEYESQRTSESSYQTAGSESAAGRAKFVDTSSGSCHRSEVPSVLNRAITLQFSPQPELDLSQTTADPRSSGEMNRNIVSTSDKSSDKSRDTNYNIKGGAREGPLAFSADELGRELQSPRHKLRPGTPRAYNNTEDKAVGVVAPSPDNGHDSPSVKATRSREKILRRLSQEFLYSPRTFTERLVTIIDESGMGYADGDASGVNLSRMTKEFRKMCKFIQDESMPEMAPSLCMNSVLGTSRYQDDDKFQNYERPATIVESPESSSTECKTPQMENEVSVKKIYRKTPLNIFKNTYRGNAGPASPSLANSTRDFEYWEKHCESLPNSPKSLARNLPKAPPLRRSLSTSDISEELKEKLILRCEEQLRSLDDTNHVEFETFDSHRGQGAGEREIERPSSYIRNAAYVTKDKNVASQSCAKYTEIDEDELSNSLRIEKELQRQRCFETAMLMQEIEEDAKRTNEEYPSALERHGINPIAAMLETISTCIAYKKCLTGIRQSNNPKQREASSVDSGIDTRSFGRTLYASSKKSYNEASTRNSQKRSDNCGSYARDPKSVGISSIRSNGGRLATGVIKKNDRKAASAGNIHKESTSKVEKRSVVVSPRRNIGFLRPAAKSLAPSRSPSRGKQSRTRIVTSSNRALKASEMRRANEIPAKLPTPDIVVVPSTTRTAICRLDLPISSRNEEATCSRINTPRPGSQRAKSPEEKSFTPSPLARNPSKERIPKMTNCHSGKSPSPAKALKSPRNRFFVTPGRNTPVNKKRKTKTYFPSMDEDISHECSQRIMKSLHAPGLYRLGYETVISPISMYIRGTDVNLVQNNHERKNEMMLTPKKIIAAEEKLKFKLASKASPSLNSPRRKGRLLVDEEDSESDDNDENADEREFVLPKANYYQAAQVHTVKESPKVACGARTRGLLQSVQNRVLIRHEGKRLGNYEDKEVPESCGESPTDMSIHVLKSAEKTNFMSRRML